MPIALRRATVAEIRPLRHAVLRAGLPPESAVFPGDDDPAAIHVGAFDDAGACIGCATLHPSTWDHQPAWQLRGMATAPHTRGTGVGRSLLEAITALGRHEGPSRFWCNARLPAVGFYQKHGWRITSESFDIPTAGPHRKMVFPAPPADGKPT